MGYSDAKVAYFSSIIVSIFAEICTKISECDLFFVSCNYLWQKILSYGIPLIPWITAM